jgi:dTDP-4-dehydrorhamnose reductase
MLRKLLVLGASGLTGYKLIQLAKRRFETYGTYNSRSIIQYKSESLFKLEVKKEENLRKIFRDIKPDIVVNTIALHNVDYCEFHQEEAFSVNAKAVGIIANLCNNLGSRLIQISTDFVFDGQQGNYSELDVPNPLNVYGKSKLEGEVQAKTSASYSIIRPSVIYGWTPLEMQDLTSSSGKPMNFALWALLKMNKGDVLKIVNDQFTTPTLADVLATIVLKLAIRESNALYHAAGTACISRYEFTKKIANMMGYLTTSIKPIKSNFLTQTAKRPTNSCLNSEKLQKDLEYKLPDIDESLSIMKSQIEIESPTLLGHLYTAKN